VIDEEALRWLFTRGFIFCILLVEWYLGLLHQEPAVFHIFGVFLASIYHLLCGASEVRDQIGRRESGQLTVPHRAREV